MNGLPDPQRSRVILIGTSRYEHLPSLPAVENNLLELAEALCAGQIWGIPTDNLAIVADPVTMADMLDPVVKAADEATDTLVLYYAGHGIPDSRRGELQLCLVGTDPRRIYTAVPYDHIRDALLESRAVRRIVILDCCYSGRALGMMAGTASAVVDEASAEGTYILSSTAENRQALAPPGERHTAFTAELLDVMSRGIPGCDALLDLDSIYGHVRATMRDKGRPLPQKRDRNTSGQLTLIRNQAYRRGQPPATQHVREPRPTDPSGRSFGQAPDRKVTSTGGKEQAFHAAMVDVFRRAKSEAGYSASYFIQMVSRNGGLATARQLLHAPKVSDGFTALWERGRLDLSVESVILKADFSDLFTEDERDLARSRLQEYDYTPPP